MIGGIVGILYTTIRRKVRAKKGLEDDICGDLSQTVEGGVEQTEEAAGELEPSDEQTATEAEPEDSSVEQPQADSEQVQSDKEER